MDVKTRFTLNAIAAAIFSFNSEITMATNCPLEVTGTALANTVCDFATVNSVTVKNNGELGGILMNSYTASRIVVDPLGLINNLGTGTGVTAIFVDNSDLTNGILNNGTINASGSIGILLNQSTSGAINNNGIISAASTALRILSSSVTGGITNTGTISAGGNNEGITIFSSTVDGGIVNTGLIEGATSGNGIIIFNGSTVNNGILNSGTIHGVYQGLSIRTVSTINGDVVNSGLIEAINSNGIELTQTSDITGSIFNSGTINAGGLGIVISTSSIVEGAISNSGVITGNSTGVLVAGTSTVAGGISNSGTIQGNNNAINIESSSMVDGINIIGDHARIIGAVEAQNTDVNITTGAHFTSEGNFNVNNLNINSNAVFNLQNNVTVQHAMNNAGVVAVASTETLTGDYTQNTGGIFQIGATDVSNYGSLTATGTVDLSASGNIDVQLGQNFSLHQGDVLANVLSGNILITPTNGFSVSDNSFIWKFVATLNDTNTGVNLTANINDDAYNICRGNYCEGAANTILNQMAAGNSAFNSFASITSNSAFQTAASQATPELTNENIQITQLITNSVKDTIPMWDVLRGKSAGDAMISDAGKLWFKPYGGSMNQNKKNTVNGFDATIYGVVMGGDIPLSENALAGAAIAIGGDHLSGKSLLDDQSIASSTYQGMLYTAMRLPYQFYLAGQALLGYELNNSKREIPLYNSTARGSFNSWFTSLSAQLGFQTYVFNQNLLFTPEVEANYLYVNQNAYKESGSPMDLSVNNNNNNALILGAYGHGAYHLTTLKNQEMIILTGYVGFSKDVLNSFPDVSATFIAGGPTFTTSGVQFNEFVFRGGLGLSLQNPSQPLKIELNYDVQSGNNAYSGVGAATISYDIC